MGAAKRVVRITLNQISQQCLIGHHFPRCIVFYAVWTYHLFALSLRDVGDQLAVRGDLVGYETIPEWIWKL